MSNQDLTKGQILNRKWIYDSLLERHTREPDNERALAELTKCHPFLLGPATLESLVNVKPATYENVKEFKLPFNDLFFEFADPIRLPMPFSKTSEEVGAVMLRANPIDDIPYSIKVYYQNKQNFICTLNLDFKQNLERATQNIFFGALTDLDGNKRPEGPKPSFVLMFDPNSGTVNYSNSGEILQLYRETGIMNLNFWFRLALGDENARNLFFKHNSKLDALENNEVFVQIPNLATNLVNYINSHNVTIVKRERQATYLDIRPNGKRKRRAEARPYNLVVLRDAIIEKPEGPGERTWELQERIFVRGHDRKYRNPDNSIRLVSWIPPHIRGPAEAPFKEQRYQVLYEKLQKEIQMFKELGLKHDSEMWVQK